MIIPLTEEQKTLAGNNHKLIYECAKKMNLSVDDYYDIMAIALCKAAQTYDTSKGNFSTLAFACMKNAVGQYRMHQRIQRNIPANMILYYDAPMVNNIDPENTDSFIDVFADDFSVHDSVTGAMIAEQILSKFNDKERKIAEYLQDGFTFHEIGKMMHCTRQNIHFIVQKMREKCIRYM